MVGALCRERLGKIQREAKTEKEACKCLKKTEKVVKMIRQVRERENE